MDTTPTTLGDLYARLSEQARDTGAFTREAWNDLVDAVIDDTHEFQELHDDAPTAHMREALMAKFDEFSKDIGTL